MPEPRAPDPNAPEPDPGEDEDLPEFDFVDPLKRDDEDELPGIDPIVVVPPD